MSEITIAIVGGRTGGHLFPALAVAESLMKLNPELNLYMIGTADGIESGIVPKAGYEFHAVRAIPLRRSASVKNLAIPFVLAAGTLQSYALLRKKRTSAIFATGGFQCVPVLAAARLAGVRFFLQEQNSYPGLTTRLFAERARVVFAAYDTVREHLSPKANLVVAGNPLRPGFEMGGVDEAIDHFHLDPKRRTMLVFGGSQGAEPINRYLADNLVRLKERKDLQLIWQTGRLTYHEYIRTFEESGVNGVVVPFIERMDLAYACSDLVLSRAGAMTLAELAAAGKPAIVVPYPFAAENHQEYNARSVQERGAAIVVKQTEMEQADMIGIALKLLDDPAELEKMARSSRALHSPEAAGEIAKAILSEVLT